MDKIGEGLLDLGAPQIIEIDVLNTDVYFDMIGISTYMSTLDNRWQSSSSFPLSYCQVLMGMR
jgi:hypothetical protein